MKQKKTIICKIDDNEKFERLVNKALEDGWTLKRRGVQRGPQHKYTALFAELEREVEA